MSSGLFTPTRHNLLLPPPKMSMMDVLAALPRETQVELLREFGAKDLESLQSEWKFIARREQLPPPGDDWNILLFCSGRGSGKMLSLDTDLRVKEGWKKLGDLKIGDTLYDENGKECQVEKLHPVTWTEDAYRLTFTGGDTLDACGEHLWITWTHRDRKQYQRYEKRQDFPENWWNWQGDILNSWGTVTGHFGPKIRTTREILDTLTHSTRQDLNHCIPIAKPLDQEEQELPLDPWVMGYWLGNGSKGALHTGSYQGNFDGDFVVEQVQKVGLEIGTHRRIERNNADYISILGLQGFLQDHGILKEKKILEEYFFGSIEQRLALLRGLMDSDGYAPRHGSDQVEFCSTTEALALGVQELVLSLGERCTLSEGRATLNGKYCGQKWRVTWRPSLFNPFSLPRKRDLIKPVGNQALRLRHRIIRSVEKIPAQFMRCITVNSPSGLFLAGRALIPTHNTRSGAEWLIHRQRLGLDQFSAIIAPTTNDLWNVCVEGESGIMSCAPNDFRPQPHRVNRNLIWPNGARTFLASAEEPERLRGPQYSAIWADEMVAWAQHSDPNESDRRLEYIWSMARFGLRLTPKTGHPEMMITTTPKPRKLIKQLIACAKGESDQYKVALITGSTYDNAKNLSPEFIADLKRQYEGTRLGQQEIYAQILEDMGGDLWTPELIEQNRVKIRPELKRIVIAVDPAVSSNEGSDTTGIVAAGVDEDGRGYVLGDHSVKGSPDQWARKVNMVFNMYDADRVVAEKNQGGDLVLKNLQTVNSTMPVKLVTATKGKYVRAEPIAALYEQGRVKHVGEFVELETQMCMMEMGRMKKSPDRADALVWALTELMLEKKGRVRAWGKRTG